MAVQRGNVQCVQGAYGEPAFEELDEIFYIVKPNNVFKMFIFDPINMNKYRFNERKKKTGRCLYRRACHAEKKESAWPPNCFTGQVM